MLSYRFVIIFYGRRGSSNVQREQLRLAKVIVGTIECLHDTIFEIERFMLEPRLEFHEHLWPVGHYRLVRR